MRIIWSCWFQGRDAAPELVRKCLQSWEDRNPGWDVRCLDADTIGRYLDLSAYVDLDRQNITAASLSDILRLLLLHEYGGIWVDATAFCTTPLDEWIDQAVQTGFFAFARPGEDREIATWFLAAAPGNSLLAKWAARAVDYWREREATLDYFWVHHQFGELITIDQDAFTAWQSTPRISANGPHSVQWADIYANYEATATKVDWSAPVFKLTHRIDEERLDAKSLLTRLLDLDGTPPFPAVAIEQLPRTPVIAGLRVSTENLGDHMQIIAGDRMLARAGWSTSIMIDRDDEIANAPPIREDAPVAIMLNGWFKTNPAQWPPHRAFDPIYLGFHIRLFQSPSLISPEAIDHYRDHQPIGCRDRYTLSLLRSRGVDAFLSHCLTLTYPRRLPDPKQQTETFVVSRDKEILNYLPDEFSAYTFLTQYSGDNAFDNNMAAARDLLELYSTRAKLIVTTMLHCALPAIAMGIPVIILYPLNNESGQISDKERFSSLSDIIRVYEPSEANLIDWRGSCPDVSSIKLRMIDAFFAATRRWGEPTTPSILGIAPSSILPVPDESSSYSYFNDPERLERVANAGAPDRQKWGAPSSYRSEWAERSNLAAPHISDGERVLEIGTGSGAFRTLVAGRCSYVGADLQPIDQLTLTLNVENDPLPQGPWDAIVLLGVLEYVHQPQLALAKIFEATDKIVISYCCPRSHDVEKVRRSRGWINSLTETELSAWADAAGLKMTARIACNSAEDFDQWIFVFQRGLQFYPR